ncbi:MAG TPA: histidine kinase dimerization/phospho-acceptor domain-containing protein, partial [Puia sp.]|nr:histidine kinase dimerization/phospho-acceptor domain-containing protein [Puia sp.]
MAQRLAMGIKLKITLAFSIVFVALNLLLNLIGYHEVRTMLMGNASTGQNLQRLRSMLVGYSLAGAAISALVSYMLARLLLRPLQRVIQAARNMTTNKMRDPIPVNGTRDEVYELTVSINEMMSRIDEALQQQQNFFGSASHELKTPLAILRTELEVGLRRQGLEESVRQLLSNQLEEISRLQAIVNEFL